MHNEKLTNNLPSGLDSWAFRGLPLNASTRGLRRGSEIQASHRARTTCVQRDGQLEKRTAKRSEPGGKLVGDLSGSSTERVGAANQRLQPEPEGRRRPIPGSTCRSPVCSR